MRNNIPADGISSEPASIKPDAISIVIVLYHPTTDDINNLIHLSQLSYNLIVIDNSDTTHEPETRSHNLKYIFNGRNLGIAKAHNIGIKKAKEQQKDGYIILLDQDSRISDSYPLEITREYIRISKKTPLSALGPQVINKTTREIYSSAIHPDRTRSDSFIPKRDIITSGCCISISTIAAVGLFDEILFIDFVDTEWCYRAKSLGFTCGITPNLNISHKIGQGELHIGKHIVTISAPARYYYIYRNYFALSHRKYIPRTFKINFGIKLFFRFFYLPFFSKNTVLCWKNMIKGVKDGVHKKFLHEIPRFHP